MKQAGGTYADRNHDDADDNGDHDDDKNAFDNDAILLRWTFYTFIHIAGIALMWDKAWVWDITQCWC